MTARIPKDNKVTIAKGIGIVLVVLGHCGIPVGKEFIYMFHMPLFFVLAGYCFKDSYLNNFKLFVSHRFKGLYIPYVKYGLMFLLLHNAFYYLNIYNGIYGYNGNISHLYNIKETIWKAVLTLMFNSNEELLGGYWFLPQLFYASIIGLLFLKISKQRPMVGVLIVLCLSIIFNIFGWYIPYTSISYLSLYATAFFLAGKLMRRHDKWLTIGCLAAALSVVLVGRFLWYSTMTNCIPLKQIPYFVSGIAGTIMVMIGSSWISSYNSIITNMFIFIGNHTLEILTWHFLSFKIVSLCTIKISSLSLEMLAMFPILDKNLYPDLWLFYAIAGIGVPCFGVMISKFLRKYILVSKSNMGFDGTK